MYLMSFAVMVMALLCKSPLQGVQRSHSAQKLITQTSMISLHLQKQSSVIALTVHSTVQVVLSKPVQGL